MTLVAPSFESSELQRRLNLLENSVIKHSSHNAAIQALENCMERARMSRRGPALTARALLLYGESGAGKTTAINDFKKPYERPPTPDGDVRPLVVVEVPEATTKRALVLEILEALGFKTNPSDSANSIVNDIADKVARLGVDMIILDEGQGMITGKAIFAISEFLKSLLNRVGCQIVIAGCPDLIAVHGHSQLNRRLLPDVSLEPYDWNTEEGRIEFFSLLGQLEINMGMPERSGLTRPDLAKRIYVASDACTGTITKYLSVAITLATERGLPHVDQPLLAEVYAKFHPAKRRTAIAFDAELKVGNYSSSEQYLAELKRRLGNQSIDADTNPFVCEAGKLSEIWGKRQQVVAERTRAGRNAKGTGPQLAPIFRH